MRSKREKSKHIWLRLGAIWLIFGVAALALLSIGLPG